MHSSSSCDPDYTNSTKSRTRPKKRRKLNKDQNPAFVFPLDAVLNASQEEEEGDEQRACFEDIIDPWLEELSRARRKWELSHSDFDGLGNNIRPLRPYEAVSSARELDTLSKQSLTPSQALLLRKLKVQSSINVAGLNERNIHAQETTLTPLEKMHPTLINADVIDALHSIQTTPFPCSFLSRLQGQDSELPLGLIAVDWETRTPWMELMADIRHHFSLAHPERDQPKEDLAPIAYCNLQSTHLRQVHDLLERSFWAGIDVTDSLDYQPEKATVLAVYKRVVVGVAILKSPQETYIMYLAVKAGWDKSQIARTMLYHLINMNPQKDITLHVSTNSSAMLLYNQFGFKAEEFVAGFYSKYLDPQSRLSTNAFKLRLRHLQN